ncbi:hypothetical protein [Acidithiobacillus sp.]
MTSITPSYDREGEHIGWKASVRKRGFLPQYQTFRTRKEATSRLFEKGFNPHGSLGHHRAQDTPDAETLYSFEG